MPEKVIKRDGRKEDFIREKIVVSCIKSGAPVDVARKIASEVEKNAGKEVRTSEIRDSVLKKLYTKNPKWSRRWLNYDESIKRLYEHLY